MRLASLSHSTFSSYGNILKARPESDETELKTFTLHDGDEISILRCTDSVVIDYTEGMTALVIYAESGPVYYYLDRIIEIQKGVPFSFFPLEQSSSLVVIHSRNASLETIETKPGNAISEDASHFELGKIFTVFYQETSGNFYFRGESHSAFELVYVDKGNLHNIINGHDYVVSMQECILIGRNQWHIQYSDLPVAFLTISFSHSGNLSDYITDRVIRISSELRQYLTKILREQSEKAFSSEYSEALLQTFLIELIRAPETGKLSQKSPATSFSENQLVDRALQMISDNISEKISLGDLSKRLHISVPYLYKLFTEHLKMPPGQYIMMIRLEESKVLLREGRKTIGEIAKECGFTSIQHYSKQFRQHFGITPSEYMRSLR